MNDRIPGPFLFVPVPVLLRTFVSPTSKQPELMKWFCPLFVRCAATERQ